MHNTNNTFFRTLLRTTLVALVGAMVFPSCSNDDMPDVYPDGSDVIQFGVSGVGTGISSSSRAGNDDYRAWSSADDPNTLGAFGFCDGQWLEENYVFKNVKMAYNSGVGLKWNYDPQKFWNEYYGKGMMDFFSYMPYKAGTELTTADNNTYTLTIPEFPAVTADSKAIPLVCASPVTYASAYNHLAPVPMTYDQVFNKFDFEFKLSEKMSKLRTFRIVQVAITNVPTTVDVAQAYTRNADSWTKGATTCTPTGNEGSLTLKYWDEANSKWGEGIRVGHAQGGSDYVSFEKPFYMIPLTSADFSPQIDVTYIVYDEETYETREATGSIILNKANFGNYASMASDGKNYYKIRINIVPDYLYVLSDADQQSGVLVVNQ